MIVRFKIGEFEKVEIWPDEPEPPRVWNMPVLKQLTRLLPEDSVVTHSSEPIIMRFLLQRYLRKEKMAIYGVEFER